MLREVESLTEFLYLINFQILSNTQEDIYLLVKTNDVDFKSKLFKSCLGSNPLSLGKIYGESFLCRRAHIYPIFVHNCEFLSHRFFWVVKFYSTHKFQFGFVDDLFVPIGLRCLITLEFLQLCILLHDVVELKF